MKQKFGLPPMPPIATGSAGRRPHLMRKKDYSPLHWDKYFKSKQDVRTACGDTFRVYECGQEGPVLFFLHGGGFSALSWALLSAEVTALVKCRCIAVDLRGHGDTVTSDDTDLSAERMSSDVGEVVSTLFKDKPPPIILVGHSMGGAIAVHTAIRGLIPTLIGIAVIDVVEGTAMDALSSMQSFLRGRPKVFDSMEKAIEWAVRSGQIQNLESARVSMVGQLKSVGTEETGPEELENVHGSATEVIAEEAEEETEGQNDAGSVSGRSESSANINSPSLVSSALSVASQESSKSPSISSHQGGKYTWRIDLSRTEKFWTGWFEGLSQKFLSCPAPKMLILAGPDRLDKDLTIGQMQGKFQMNLLPQCGHAVHEDLPDKVADILANFMLRHRVTEALADFQRSVPGC